MPLNPSQRSSNEREDQTAQRAVLALVLYEYPAALTAREIGREVGQDDATERALRDLVACGLLRREGESMLPTRATLQFDRLVP